MLPISSFKKKLPIGKVINLITYTILAELLFIDLTLAEEIGHVEVNLVSENSAIQPGKTFYLGLKMDHNSGWHTYWKNPGAAGMATTVTWKTSDLIYGEINWPVPHRFNYGNYTSYGLTGNQLLIVPVTLPKSSKNTSIIIEGDVNWLECGDVCIPAKKHLTISMPVGKRSAIESSSSPLFVEARRAMATTKNNKKIKAIVSEENLAFEIPGHTEIKNAYFYPYNENIVEDGFVTALAKSKSNYQLVVGKLNPNAEIADGIMTITYSNGEQKNIALHNTIKKSDSCLDILFN